MMLPEILRSNLLNDVKENNIGTEDNPRIVRLSKNLSAEEKDEYVKLMKKYIDVSMWSYDGLKEYDTSIIHHTIPMKPGEKPFSQKLRKINPMLLPIVEKEIEKLFDAKIIVTLRFLKWVSNLVPVSNKNGEIGLCVDFRKLNRVSLKDNYPLPKMD